MLLQFAFEFIDFFFKVGDASFQADDDFSSFNMVFILRNAARDFVISFLLFACTFVDCVLELIFDAFVQPPPPRKSDFQQSGTLMIVCKKCLVGVKKGSG